MKICYPNSTSILNFSARKKEIREADLILRNAKRNYPIMSSTYISETYKCLSKQKSAQSILENIKRKIAQMRKYVSETSAFLKTLNTNSKCKTTEPIFIALDEIQKRKIGNCFENAELGLAALYSNGYMNSNIAILEYKTQIIHKETGFIMYEDTSLLDHVFVLTDMNKGGKKDIVFDPWLSFVDSISGAKERFKKIYSREELKEKENEVVRDFKNQFISEIDMSKYNVRSGFYFNVEKYKNILKDEVKTKEDFNSWYPKLKVKKLTN